MYPHCAYCDDDENLRYDHHEGNLVCTKCGFVLETHYMNETVTVSPIDQWSFFDHECYDSYPLIGIEYDAPFAFIQNAYDKASEIINLGNYRGSNKLYIQAASFFLICKENNKDKTYEEICGQYNIPFVKLSKGIKICLESGVFTDNDHNPMCSKNEEVILFNKYMSTFPMSNAKVKIFIRKTFSTILKSSKDIMIGKSVKTIVCCILCYIFERSDLCKQIPYNKDDISKNLQITKVTLNKVMNLISASLLN